MNKNKNVIVIGVVCGILTLGIAIQLRTINNSNIIVSKTEENTELRDSAIKWKEKYYQSITNLENAENELKNLRQEATKNNPEAIEKEKQLANNNILLGITDVKGPGVIITLSDNESVNSQMLGLTDDIRDYLEIDKEIKYSYLEFSNSEIRAICS